jgi:ParB/RepB/Spo0J family partition protein
MPPARKRPVRTSSKKTPESTPSNGIGGLYGDKDHSGDLLDLPLDSLCPNPFNRRQMKGVPELAETIREVGLIHPITHIRRDVWLTEYPETVDAITADNVILVGEHRWRAMLLLGESTIPSFLQDAKVKQARTIILIENLRRAQMSELEEALHYQSLRDVEGLSYEEIARRVGETAKGALSKGTVWKRVQLLDLDPAVQTALASGAVNVTTAQRIKESFADHEPQREVVRIIHQGVPPRVAIEQVLGHQRQAGEDEQLPASEAATNAGTEADSADVAADPVAKTTEPAAATVSIGNATTKQARRSDASPAAPDALARVRQNAAADRDAACWSLLETIDLDSSEGREIALRTMAIATLVPPQQSAAQRKALAWLQKTGSQALDVTPAKAYFDAVQDSADAGLVLGAAFATALATCELRTAERRQNWGALEVAYVRMLMEHARYEPMTEWEQRQLGLAPAGEA